MDKYMKDIISGRSLMLGLVSRGGMIFFNIIIFVISLFSAIRIVQFFIDPTNNLAEIDDILNALSTTFVAYGVTLEERENILRIFNSSKNASTSGDDKLNPVCHDNGLIFLVLALFVEVTSELVKVPGIFVNLKFIEEGMAISGMFLMSLLLLKLLFFTAFLVFPNDLDETKPH